VSNFFTNTKEGRNMMRDCILAKLLKTASPLAFLCLATMANANIVTNGDFESGDQDFLTDYTLGIGITAQRYNVTTNPSLHHVAATSYGDHTSGSGYMMAVNAATAANQLVWGQEVTLTENTEYEFSLWVSSWTPSAPANLEFDIGGVSLGSFVAPSQTATWDQYLYSFNSGATSGPVLLSIIDTTRAAGGDDFALDDISLKAVPLPPAIWLFLSGLAVASRFKHQRSV
jgi:hypothetical protein